MPRAGGAGETATARGRRVRRRRRLTAASPSLLKAVDSWASWKSVRDNWNLSQRSLLYCWPGKIKQNACINPFGVNSISVAVEHLRNLNCLGSDGDRMARERDVSAFVENLHFATGAPALQRNGNRSDHIGHTSRTKYLEVSKQRLLHYQMSFPGSFLVWHKIISSTNSQGSK